MFKAFALCFLNTIPNVNALARVLGEKPNLQYICGIFDAKGPPRRIHLYRFQTYSEDVFADIMRHTLIAIVLAAKRLNLGLPFVRTVSLPEDNFTQFRAFSLADTGMEVEFWGTSASNEQSKHSLERNLDLPAKVKILQGDTVDEFILDIPYWILEEEKLRGKDTVIGVVSGRNKPYIACNILVLHKDKEGNEVILLAERLNGSGIGHFALPGGKKRPDESILKCTQRELREEVGLILKDANPVSVRITKHPGQPVVASVGILVTKFSGKPYRKENFQHSEWDWYMMQSVPSPLFKPSSYVIEDYKNSTFQGLTWNALETLFSELEEDADITEERNEDSQNINDEISQEALFEN
jgi:8-oxo-dGTP diphosphatase